ncbi:MAG TPA: hypothetical protein VLJ59_16625 [Mycobacteriales bacterium]|nr:hypothetical protein [Mycobacteriales bacterium]
MLTVLRLLAAAPLFAKKATPPTHACRHWQHALHTLTTLGTPPPRTSPPPNIRAQLAALDTAGLEPWPTGGARTRPKRIARTRGWRKLRRQMPATLTRTRTASIGRQPTRKVA